MLRWRRLIVVAGVGLAVTALIGAGALLRGPAARSPVPARPETAVVTRQTLVAVTTVAGKLGYGPEQLIEPRVTGTVTAVPAVGAALQRGMVLFRIDDKPVVLLFGTLPAYRELTAGHAAVGANPDTDSTPGSHAGSGSDAAVPATKGADVKEFETNLKALGYAGFTVDEQYNGQTAAAVRRWQKDLGLEQTGVVELGRVFFAPGPLRVAKVKASPGAVTGGPVLACTGTVRLVTATLPAHDQPLAKAGAKVTVALPSGTELPGTVLSVRTPDDDQAAAAGQEPTIEAVVRFDDPAAVGELDDGPARVRFVAQQRNDVLVVPVGALLALAEGGYGLEVIDGAGSRIVPVTTGLFADGRVEINGPGIWEGMTVGTAK
jgi:peptidoglycan hydrolase-like protein with peptidoglycan-binding domain